MLVVFNWSDLRLGFMLHYQALWWNINKIWIENWIFTYFVMVIRSAYNVSWRRSPISYNHVFLWHLFLDPHLTTHDSKIGVPQRKVSEKHLLILRYCPLCGHFHLEWMWSLDHIVSRIVSYWVNSCIILHRCSLEIPNLELRSKKSLEVELKIVLFFKQPHKPSK